MDQRIKAFFGTITSQARASWECRAFRRRHIDSRRRLQVRVSDLPPQLLHPLPREEQILGAPLRREGEGAGQGDGGKALRCRDPVPGGPQTQPKGIRTVTWGGCARDLHLVLCSGAHR